MNFQHSYPSPPRFAVGGPVTAAIRAMREANDLPPLLAEQFDREADEIAALRETIQRQLAADFDRIDRCLVILDSLDGDDDLEADHSQYRRQPDGSFATVAFTSDDEPSLCGVGTHDGGSSNWPSYPVSGHNCGGDQEDMEAGDFDDEPTGDDEPSLGSPNISLLGLDVRHVNAKATRRLPDEPFAVGSGDDREHDDADGPEGDDEREGVHGSSSGTDDDEPSLCGVTVNSLFATGTATWDGEMSLGTLGGTAVDCEGSQVNNARGDRTDKEEDTGSRTHNKPRESSWSPSPAVKAVRDDLRRRADAKWLARRGTSNVTLIGIR